ncbi:MAG: MFS transporter [Anaerovoracaceae bacterium]
MFGYSLGFIGDTCTYNFMSAYFVLFLTDCVGMKSFSATSIVSIALFVEVIAGIFVGDLSDNCILKMGRRRPFILFASLAMPVVMIFLMIKISLSTKLTFLYYLLFSVLFRIAFVSYEISNNAFGAEIATGYDERTRLRTMSRALSIIGNVFGHVIPLLILQLFVDDETKGWFCIGITLAIVSFMAWFGEFMLTKPYDSPSLAVGSSRNPIGGILRNYKEICSLKPMKYLIFYKTMFTCAYALFSIANIYYLKYCLGLSSQYSAYMFILSIGMYIVSIPVVEKTTLKLGKSKQQIITLSMSSITGIIIYLTGAQSLALGIIYILVFALLYSSFWQVSGSIFYDIAEVDEFVHRKRREGNIMSFVSIIGTIITAIMTQIYGITLDYVGYDPSVPVQTESTILFIKTSFILIPCICAGLGAVSLKKFPITKEKFVILTEALKARNNNEPYEKYLNDLGGIV